MFHRKRLISAIIPAALALAYSSQLLAEDVIALEEIIVTAQKRNESLQDVPISETVLSSEAIRSMQFSSGSEIARQTPNLNVSKLGNEDQPKFSMRGISTSAFNLNASSATGVFTDEVFVSSSFLGGQQMFDMERVEVLRGPQGTLFGKNTTAGAINFITKAPTFEQEGYVTASLGNNNFKNVSGAINTPLIEDKLAARLAFNYTDSDGWVDNACSGDGLPGLCSGEEDLSSIDNHAVRLGLRYEEDDFDATLRLFSVRSNPTNIGVFTRGTNTNGTNVAGINPRVNPITGAAFDSHEGAFDNTGHIKVKGDGGYLTMNWSFDNFDITSITSLLNGEFYNPVDGDGTFLPITELIFATDSKEQGQDLRLSTTFDGPLNFIAGLYYFQDKNDILFDLRVNGAPGEHLYQAQTYEQTRTQYAVYVDATYDFTDQLIGYAGIRWTDDEGKIKDFNVANDLTPAFTGAPVTLVFNDGPYKRDYHDSEPTGRIGLRYHFSDDTMGYAQFVRGYRSSEINGGALNEASLTVVSPEFLDAYELGLKTQLLDNRVSLNSALFYYDFSDQQFINSVSLTDQQLVNAGASSILGLELEAVARLTSALQVSAGLGWLDTEYDELVLTNPNTNAPIDLSGNELIEAPELSANLAIDYTIAMSEGEVTAHFDTAYVSSQFYTAFNDNPATFPQNLNESDAFWESNARLSYNHNDQYEVSLWVKNLNDNDEIAGSQVNASSATHFATVPYPRRYGIDFRYNW